MDPRQLDLNLLRVFDAVMTLRSVSRAAEGLGLTQPAVSNALARLRGALGDDLFLRTPKGMEPTARALALAPPLRAALDGIHAALAPERPFDPASARDVFSIGASDHGETALVPRLATWLAEAAPGISLRVRHADREDAFALMEAGEIDLALGVLPEPPSHLVRVVVMRDRLVSLVRADHPAADDWTLDSFLAAGHVLVSPTGDERGAVDRALSAMGKSRRVAVVLSHYGGLAPLVRSTDLVVTLPEHVAVTFAAAQGLVVREPPLPLGPVRLHAIWHRRDERRAAHVWLRRGLQALARQPAP
jgi:LysR family transcriptional activator of mexEF-oprN operon